MKRNDLICLLSQVICYIFPDGVYMTDDAKPHFMFYSSSSTSLFLGLKRSWPNPIGAVIRNDEPIKDYEISMP